MMNRRRTLATIGVAIFGEPFVSRARELRRSASPDNLRADIERIGSRAYSEEGVPMFLVCVNVAGTAAPVQPGIASALNKKVSSAFRRYAEEWQRLKPNAPVTDVAKIVEFIADRDFANGGNETRL